MNRQQRPASRSLAPGSGGRRSITRFRRAICLGNFLAGQPLPIRFGNPLSRLPEAGYRHNRSRLAPMIRVDGWVRAGDGGLARTTQLARTRAPNRSARRGIGPGDEDSQARRSARSRRRGWMTGIISMGPAQVSVGALTPPYRCQPGSRSGHDSQCDLVPRQDCGHVLAWRPRPWHNRMIQSCAARWYSSAGKRCLRSRNGRDIRSSTPPAGC